MKHLLQRFKKVLERISRGVRVREALDNGSTKRPASENLFDLGGLSFEPIVVSGVILNAGKTYQIQIASRAVTCQYRSPRREM